MKEMKGNPIGYRTVTRMEEESAKPQRGAVSERKQLDGFGTDRAGTFRSRWLAARGRRDGQRQGTYGGPRQQTR